MENLSQWLTPPVVWFVVGLVLLLLEIASPGIVIIFFGIGAWLVALITIFVDISINVQLIVFIITSTVLLLLLRKKLEIFFEKRAPSSEEEYDEFVGQKAVVTTEVDPKAGGRVEFRGTNWDAESDEHIAVGVAVEIVEKTNITLKVKPL